MKVFLASDHAGFELKEKIKSFLEKKNYDVVDCGAENFNKDDDYPDFIAKAALSVSKDLENSKGIVFGKSGTGEGIVANKIKGIRSVVGFNEENIKLSREHNDTNILSLGSEFVTQQQAQTLVILFLETPFSNEERHKRRIEKIKQLEN